MNRHLSNVTSLKVATLALTTLCSVAHAGTALWNGAHSYSQSWEEAQNWNNNTPPRSGIDSIRFHAPDPSKPAGQHTDASLHAPFIIGDGQRMDSTANSKGVLRISNNGHLIVAKGGTLDFATQGNFTIAEGRGTMRLTVEAGAQVAIPGFYNGNNQDHTTEFIADQTGVSPIKVSHSAFIRGGRLEVDLEHYQLENGTDLVLFTQLRHPPQSTGFSEIKLSEGWSGDIDYHYTTVSGQAAIALTNLSKKGAPVGIPEPHTYALIFAGITASLALSRRRRL